jgi:hypothetical protein
LQPLSVVENSTYASNPFGNVTIPVTTVTKYGTYFTRSQYNFTHITADTFVTLTLTLPLSDPITSDQLGRKGTGFTFGNGKGLRGGPEVDEFEMQNETPDWILNHGLTLSVIYQPDWQLSLSETFPSPDKQFAVENVKAATWLLNFTSTLSRYFVSVDLVWAVPQELMWRDGLIFFSGIIISTGAGLISEVAYDEHKKRSKTAPEAIQRGSDADLSRTPDKFVNAMQNYHNNSVLPVWQATVSSARTDTAEFFDLSHEVWLRCESQIPKIDTITSIMHAVIWGELTNAFYESFSANYLSSVRALRFVFEFATQAALLEEKYKGLADDKTKFGKAFGDADFQRFRFKMIDQLNPKIGLTGAECEQLELLYRDLSVKGTHANPTFLSNLKLNILIFGQFDAPMFGDCRELCRKVVDFVVVVLFAKYPALRSDSVLKGLAKDLKLSMTMARMP